MSQTQSSPSASSSSASSSEPEQQLTDLQAYVLRCPKIVQSNRTNLFSNDPLNILFSNNRAWSKQKRTEDPEYFGKLSSLQSPQYLWIGCSDSRVPANVILGLEAGEVFVQRNVGNQATHTDLNCMSCLEYAVTELKVKTVIVCGHYGCGAVKAALNLPSKTAGLVNCWISDIRECRNQHEGELRAMDEFNRQDRLCELNVLRQTFHVCTSPVIQAAWDRGQQLNVYGLIYSLKDGLIKKLVGPLSGDNDFVHDLKLFVDENVMVGPRSCASPVLRSGSNSNLSSNPGNVGLDGGPSTTATFAAELAALKLGLGLGAGTAESSALLQQRIQDSGIDEDEWIQLRNTAALASKVTQHVAWSSDGGSAH